MSSNKRLSTVWSVRRSVIICHFLLGFVSIELPGQEVVEEAGSGSRARAEELGTTRILPGKSLTTGQNPKEDRVRWRPLLSQSLRFGIMKY